MKTILFVETGSGFGGSATCLDSLIRCLDHRKYRPVVAYGASGLGTQRIERQGVSVVQLNEHGALWQLLEIIRRERVDLVHANNEIYSHWGTIVAARLSRRPCIVHMRGIRQPLTRLERLLIPHSAHFIVISQLGLRTYADEGIPLERSSVLYDGIDLEQFNRHLDPQAVRRQLGVRDGELVIGIVSRLVPKKGHKDFLKAVAQIRLTLPQVRAVIVGSDPYPGEPHFHELQGYARELGLADSVIFTGWRDDIPALTAAFDIAAQASHYIEGLGTAVIEAMALGKPVVATAVGGVKEVVVPERTGLLVPPGDPDQLACALRRLVTNEEERQRFGEAGRERARTMFDQRQLSKDLESLYERLLHKGARSR